MCNTSDQFHKEIQNIIHRGLGSPMYAKLGHFMLLFSRKRQRNVQLLFSSLNLLFGDVPVSVAVGVCLSETRRRRQRERHETKGLMSKTIAAHVRYKYLYISLPSSAKQQREMTKFCVVWRT